MGCSPQQVISWHLQCLRTGGQRLSGWQLSYLQDKEDDGMKAAHARADSTLQTWISNCSKQPCSHTENGNIHLKPNQNKKHHHVQLRCFLQSWEQMTAAGAALVSEMSESGRGESRASLSLSLCCPELLPKTVQATQRLNIYWWLCNIENYYTCMPYSEIHWAAPTLAVGHQVHKGWQMPRLSQAQAPVRVRTTHSKKSKGILVFVVKAHRAPCSLTSRWHSLPK